MPSTVALALRTSARLAHEHKRASGGVDIFAIHGEDGVPAHHREQLLVAVGEIAFVVGLVVRLHHLITRVPGDEMVEPHDEPDDEGNLTDGHEELFEVMSGHAVFTVDGEVVDGPRRHACVRARARSFSEAPRPP